MNVKLNWRSEFLAICAYNDKIFPNQFDVELQMVTHTENPRHQNVAFERMKVIVNELFAHGIFVGHENENLSALIDIYPEKIVLLPEEAYDQVIAIALFCKVNAVMENAITCTSVRISSHFGDHVWYQYDSGDAMGPFAVAKSKGKRKQHVPWWNRNDLMTFDADGEISVTTWDELELDWEEAAESEVFEFKPEKTADVIDIKKSRKKNFRAEVIEGGKKDEN
jgi:hypothetical protein